MSITNRKGLRIRLTDDLYLQYKISTAEIQELKGSLKFVECHLSNTKSENNRLVQSLESIIKDNLAKDATISDQNEIIKSKESKIEFLEHQLEKSRDMIEEKKSEFTSHLHSMTNYQIKLLADIQILKESIAMSMEEVAIFKYSKAKTKLKLKSIISFKDKEIEDTDREPVKTFEYVKQIPYLQQEIQRLNIDNCKLFEVLKSQKLTKHMSNLSEDSHGITFYPDKGRCGKRRCASNCNVEDSN